LHRRPSNSSRYFERVADHGGVEVDVERARPADVFDLKGVLELLLRRLAIPGVDLAGNAGLPSHLHPGQGATIRLRGEVVGSYGVLHPDARAAAELRDEVLVAELRLDGLLEQETAPVRVAPLERFPAVARDLSLLCDARQSAAALLAVIREAGGSSLRSVTFVDRYDRPPVPPGRLSLTVGLQFQDRSRTLTGEEVQATVENVVRGLRAAGAEIRSE
jgi:phenylalanyl-tRNA synthetase beta chain